MSSYKGVDEAKFNEFEDKIKRAYRGINTAPTNQYQRKVIRVIEKEGIITIIGTLQKRL